MCRNGQTCFKFKPEPIWFSNGRGRPFTPTLCATCFGQNRSLKIGEGAWPHRTRTRSTQVYTSLSCLSQPRCNKSGASQGASNQVPAKVHQIDSLEIRVDECKRQVGRMVADLRLVICMPERLGQRIPRHGSATGCPTCCISRPAASQTLFIVYIFENLSNICTRGWGE